MIATTLGAIAAADGALDRMGARPLPVKTAYSMAKLLKLIRAELQEYRTLHDELVRRYGVEAEPGSGNFHVTPSNWSAFRSDLETLRATPVEIAWTPIALDALGADPVRADDLVALEPFLAETPTPTPTT